MWLNRKMFLIDCFGYGVFSPEFRCQFFAALTLDIISFAHGIGIGWLSPTLAKLLSKDSPLDFPITLEEASWIGSLFGLGALIGTIIYGFLLNRVGRKICIYTLAIPQTCLWILVYFAQSVEYLYVARIFGGLTGGGCFLVVPIFISEIADRRIRGTLTAMIMLTLNFGILVGYILCTFLSYHVVPFFIIVLPWFYLIGSTAFPETPQYLLQKGQIEAAERSFKFYKNYNDDTNDHCHKELQSQRSSTEFLQLKALVLKQDQGPDGTETNLTWQDFVTKPALRAFCTAIVLLFINQFSGSFAFINYMSHIFAESGAPLEPNSCSIIVAIVQIIGACTATALVDQCGRKLLMLCSTAGLSVVLLGFGSFTQWFEFFPTTSIFIRWLPLILMMIVIFLSNIGIVSLTFGLLVEIFPVKIRPVASSMSVAGMSVSVFSALKIFPLYMQAFGISITMWSCSLVCLAAFSYLWLYLPETKGKSMESD